MPRTTRPSCGLVHPTPDALSNDFVEAALVKALFPRESVRRRLHQGSGHGHRDVGDPERVAVRRDAGAGAGQGRASLEKPDLKIGFIAITCATPLIMADPLGFYKKQGLTSR